MVNGINECFCLNSQHLESAVDPYASVQASDPDEAALLPTPTPTYTPSATPLIPPTPTPTVTPSITPTPSTPTFIRQNAITIQGSNDITRIVRNIPNELMPEYIGDHKYGGGILAATGWEFISNQGYYFANDPCRSIIIRKFTLPSRG